MTLKRSLPAPRLNTILVVCGAACALAIATVMTAPAAEPESSTASGPGEDVARSNDGQVLHRRLPANDNVGGEFIYDPQALDTTLPSELIRDGNPHPRPQLAPEPQADEAVLTDRGFIPSDEASEDPPETDADSSAVAGSDPDAPPGGGGGGGDPAPGADPDGDNPKPKPRDGDENGGIDPRTFNGDTAIPDRQTGREDRLDYHAVFDPSLVPFKRNRALNSVTPTYGVELSKGHVSEIEPEGIRSEAGRESFWGSLLIDARAGKPIPLPSVAPSSRILRAEIVPPVEARFFKDEADNFYVQTSKSGRFRLVFVMDAPTGYFGRPLPPSDVRLKDVPKTRLRPLPPKVRRDGLAFAAELGLKARGGYSETLNTLVTHFRGFLPGDPPTSTDNIYLDLARGKKGICRHRSFGFVVTAQALGIPARYVFNEAHVFVEVFVPGPDAGWLRIDLGGGANDLHVHSAADKLQHKPRGRDPFAPASPSADGPTQDNLAGATTVHGAPPEARPPGIDGGDTQGTTLSSSSPLGVPTPMVRAGAGPTRTTLSLSRSLAFRGDALVATGRVEDLGGEPASHGTVQIIIARASAALKPIRLLATGAVNDAGNYSINVSMPLDQAPGNYEIRAQFMGNARLNPSTSP